MISITLLVVFLLLILATAVFGVFRATLHGRLILVRYDPAAGDGGKQTETQDLSGWPWLLVPTHALIGVPGRMLVVGIPFTHRMHIWIRCPRRPLGDGTLRRGGRGYISGIWLTHDFSERGDLQPASDPDAIESWRWEGEHREADD